MKPTLLLCLCFLTAQALYGQLPTGPDGKTLYQKGDCKTILPNVKYKCVFCEDKALTKNCKEYDCSLTECKESKSVKGGNGQTMAKPVSIIGKEVKRDDESDSSSKIPRGTKFENGKVIITKGYKGVYSTDKKMIFIVSDNGLDVEGTFSCACVLGLGNCALINNGGAIGCGGDPCCKFKVSTESFSGVSVLEIERTPEKLKWKNLVIPGKVN